MSDTFESTCFSGYNKKGNDLVWVAILLNMIKSSKLTLKVARNIINRALKNIEGRDLYPVVVPGYNKKNLCDPVVTAEGQEIPEMDTHTFRYRLAAFMGVQVVREFLSRKFAESVQGMLDEFKKNSELGLLVQRKQFRILTHLLSPQVWNTIKGGINYLRGYSRFYRETKAQVLLERTCVEGSRVWPTDTRSIILEYCEDPFPSLYHRFKPMNYMRRFTRIDLDSRVVWNNHLTSLTNPMEYYNQTRVNFSSMKSYGDSRLSCEEKRMISQPARNSDMTVTKPMGMNLDDLHRAIVLFKKICDKQHVQHLARVDNLWDAINKDIISKVVNPRAMLVLEKFEIYKIEESKKAKILAQCALNLRESIFSKGFRAGQQEPEGQDAEQEIEINPNTGVVSNINVTVFDEES